jgi:hypothetical protein
MIATSFTWLLLGSSCPGERPLDGGDDDNPADTDISNTDATTTTLAGPRFGFTTVSSGTIPAAPPNSTPTSATAGFLDAGAITECIRVVLDENCAELTCTVLDQGSVGGVSAGTIEIVGLTSPIELVESDLYPGLYPGFYQASGPSFFAPGAEVTVTASGETVPAFSLTTPAPHQNLVLTDPEPADGPTPVTITSDTDLRYAWEPVDGGEIQIGLSFLEGPDAMRSITCSRLGSPLVNEVVIPLVDKDRYNGIAALESVRYFSSVTTQVGDYAVTFELSSPVVTAAGTAYPPRTILFDLD